MSPSASLVATILLLAIVLALACSASRVRSRLRREAEEGAKLLPDTAADGLTWHHDPIRQLGSVHDRLLDQIEIERGLLRDEVRRRARAEEQLRENQERYALAVSGANDGMWEWNLKSGTAEFSPRWKSMLGYADEAIGDSIQEWHDRIHGDDRDETLTELDAHIRGTTPRFESEHRIRCKDGTWRWVLSRASTLRHANGNPYRVVGLNTDITSRKQVQLTLLQLADAFNDLRGDELYRSLVARFASIVGTREAFIAECADFPTTRVRMLAYWYHDRFAPNQEFDLAMTPCEEVVCNSRPLFVPTGLPNRFPSVKAVGVESYLGLPCIDTRGIVIGHIVCKDSIAIGPQVPHQAILKLFAVRASIELERRLLARLRDRIGAQSGSMH